jgi:radical SAM superfamily enzyme YgiQ (UPF0313 family)
MIRSEMDRRPVLLVNTNVSRPPVSPVGLEYVSHALIDAGVPVEVVDLAFEDSWRGALRRALQSGQPLMVGVSVRNTDDCSFKSKKSFLPWIASVVTEVNNITDAPVFLGGVGFSAMPEVGLKAVPATAGIAGDGEEVVIELVGRLEKNEEWMDLPGIVYRRGSGIVSNYTRPADLNAWPLPRRRVFDNQRYQKLGAMVGIETKRGCSQKCIYCADPLAKGRRVRLRPPATVVEEIRDLLDQEVCWMHICDSEFNLPAEHAKEVCRSIVEAGLGDRVRWYTYCSPVPFDTELARLMKSAGCAGINFGVDSLCDEQLARLCRTHSLREVLSTIAVLRSEGINYIFDLLVGGPGETPQTLRTTIERVREYDIPLAGIAAGVRVYPGTALAMAIAEGATKGKLFEDESHTHREPVFYLSPELGDDLFSLIDELVAGDRRFLHLSAPSDEASYNYADDEMLARLIEQGARGAYWDILRRNRQIDHPGGFGNIG